RRRKADARDPVDDDAAVLGRLVRPIDGVLYEERAVLAHVGERREPLFLRRLGQPGHAVLEDPAVELFDPQLGAGAVGRLEVLADAERAVGIDAPRELDPELVLFPHLAEAGGFVRLPREVERLAALLERDAQDGLAKADPACGVR